MEKKDENKVVKQELKEEELNQVTGGMWDRHICNCIKMVCHWVKT